MKVCKYLGLGLNFNPKPESKRALYGVLMKGRITAIGFIYAMEGIY